LSAAVGVRHLIARRRLATGKTVMTDDR